MDLHDAATAAIEDWARRHRPHEAGLRWAARTPAADWQYDDMTWNREMNEIQRSFERRIGSPISLSPSERRKTAGLTLMKTHYVLVRKAETSSPGGTTLLKALTASAGTRMNNRAPVRESVG